MVDGLTVPAQIPGDAHGSVSFAWRPGCAAEPDALQFARMIGGAAFEAADSIANPDRMHIGPRLTNRQRQCLIRAAQGNPIWRIGRHLELSPDTVREHLRSEEHTSELQSLMRISYAVFCLTKKNKKIEQQ